MGEETLKWFRGIPGVVKALPYVVMIFSGSAAGGITASYSVPRGYNIEASEARIIAAIGQNKLELERVYGLVSALDERQRAMHTQVTRLEVVTSSLKSEHKNAHSR